MTVPFDCQIYPEKEVKIANRFSGESISNAKYAAVYVYDTIIGAERFEDWDTVHDAFKAWTGSKNSTLLGRIHGGAGLMPGPASPMSE